MHDWPTMPHLTVGEPAEDCGVLGRISLSGLRSVVCVVDADTQDLRWIWHGREVFDLQERIVRFPAGAEFRQSVRQIQLQNLTDRCRLLPQSLHPVNHSV